MARIEETKLKKIDKEKILYMKQFRQHIQFLIEMENDTFKLILMAKMIEKCRKK